MAMRRVKTIEQSIRDTDEPEHRLRKSLSAVDLVVFGVGVVIGTGIFVLTGQQAALNAGPAIVISFILAALVCGLAALCYAEFASTVPVAGSAYAFGYATFGELVAWIIGWDLVLELTLAAAVVARGWSAYAQNLLDLPTNIAGDNAVVDLAAIFIVLVIGVLLVLGTKLSGRVTGVLVAVKVAVVLFVVVAGLFFIDAANYSPFVPPAVPAEAESGGHAPLIQVLAGLAPSHFGLWGVVAAAAIVFFAFIGFDVVSTTAEETRNPQRDMPRGIIGTLIIVTILYAAVSFVITGMRPYKELNSAAPLAEAFDGVGATWAAKLISLGGIAGITTVVLVLMLGQARVFFAMARDGLLPPALAKVHPRFGTPWIITIVTTVLVAALSGFVTLSVLAEMVNIGTLFAFVVVSVGVIVLRRTRPDLPRAFRVPGVPVLPVVSILACIWLMLNLPVDTWIRFAVWMLLGLLVYVAYGWRNSRFARGEPAALTATTVEPPPGEPSPGEPGPGDPTP
ncbi:MAG: amino acid permease [Streptosporangiales bacterium]|nr:amino acid permease [Streptosporangiales bacterium]